MMNEEQTYIYELHNITKTFGEKKIISSLSINLKRNELVAIIGPSGAGKTTLLNILANVIQPNGGQILLDQKPIQNYKNSKIYAKKVGIINQQFNLVGKLAVINNVLAGRFNEWNLGKSLLSLIIPQDKKIALNALERVGMKAFTNEKTENLSGGEQQRVAIARILVQNPEIILADEPVSSLDPTRADDILEILTTIAKTEKKSFIAVIHSIGLARKYFDRIIAMKDGMVVFDLPANKVTDDELANLYKIEGQIEHE